MCTTVIIGGVMAAPTRDEVALPPLDLAQIDPPAPDDESLSYAFPAIGSRYSAGSPWLYLLADISRDTQDPISEENVERRSRPKRKMPSLSINNPMEVLRQRLLLEVARKQMREANQRQAVANRLFLQNVGKRGYWAKPMSFGSRYDN